MPDYGSHIILPGRQRDMVIPEAELLLPDDQLKRTRRIVVRSSWFAGTYQSLTKIIEARKQAEAKLNAQMEDWQRELAPPCFLQYGVRDPSTDGRVLVYGAIPTIADFVEDEARVAGRLGPERDKFGRRLTRRMEDAARRGWLYGQWFSVKQKRGEWGAQHKAVMQRVITEAEFNDLKERSWQE